MEWMEPLTEAPVVGLGEPLVATVLVDGALHIGSSRRQKRMRYLATANAGANRSSSEAGRSERLTRTETVSIVQSPMAELGSDQEVAMRWIDNPGKGVRVFHPLPTGCVWGKDTAPVDKAWKTRTA